MSRSTPKSTGSRALYKSKIKDVSSVTTRRKSRGLERKRFRDDEVNKRRLISDDMSPVVEDGDVDIQSNDVMDQSSPIAIALELERNNRSKKSTAQNLQDRLKLWREEKKKKQKLKSKPTFKVGGVKHKVEAELYQKQEKHGKNVSSKHQQKSPVKQVVVTRTRTAPSTRAQPEPVATRALRKTKTLVEQRKPAPVKSRKVEGENTTAVLRRSSRSEKKLEVSDKLAGVGERKADLRNKSGPNGKSTRDLSSKLTAAARAKMNEQKHSDYLKAKPHSRPTRSSTRNTTSGERKIREEKTQEHNTDTQPSGKRAIVHEETSSSSDSQTEVQMLESNSSLPLHSTPSVKDKTKKKSSSGRRKSRTANTKKAALKELEENLSVIVNLEGKHFVSSDEGLTPPSKRHKNEVGDGLDAINEEGQAAEVPELNEAQADLSTLAEGLGASHVQSEMVDQLDLSDTVMPEVTNLSVTLHLAEAQRNVSLWAQPKDTHKFGDGDQGRDSLAKLSTRDSVLDRSDKENVLAVVAGCKDVVDGRRKTANATASSDENTNQNVPTPKKVSGTPRRNCRRVSEDHQNSDAEKSNSPAVVDTPRRKSTRINSDTENLNLSAIVKTPKRKNSVVKTPRRKSTTLNTPKEKGSLLILELKECQSSETKERKEKKVKTPRRKSCIQSPAIDSAKEHVSDGELIKVISASHRRSSRVSFAGIKADSDTPQSQKATIRKTPFRRSIRLMTETTDSSDQETVSSQSKIKRQSVRKSLLRKETVEEVYPTSDPTDSDTQTPLTEDNDATPTSQQRQRMGSALAKRKSQVLDGASASSADESDHPSVKQCTPRSIKKRQSGGTPGSGKAATPRSAKRNKRSSRRVLGKRKSQRRSSSTLVSVNDEGTEWVQGDNVIGQVYQSPGTPANHENKLPATPTSRHSRRSTVLSVSDEGTSVASASSPTTAPLAYQVKQASAEKDTRILQELVVEKVEGETSFIEVPLESSVEGDSSGTLSSSTPPQHQSTQTFTPDSLEEGSSSAKSSACRDTSTSERRVQFVTPELTEQGTPKAGSSRVRGRSLTPYTSFKQPGTPLSALRNRSARHRKTEHSTPSRSPEEMLEILKNSPMVEMTRRRRSRHASSPAKPSRFEFTDDIQFEPKNLSAPELTTEPQVFTEGAEVTTDSPQVLREDTSAPKSLLDEETASKVNYFRDLVNSETDRLKGLCKEWEELNCYTFGLSEEVQGQIRSVVGKAQLLMAQRFKQFSGLMDDCEFKRGEKKTTPTDLQGFWEMIYFQVEDVNTLFVKLHELKMNNWQVKQATPKKKVIKKKAAAAAKPDKKVKSNFAAFRAAMIKKNVKASEKVTNQLGQGDEETKTFDAGFFKVNSPVKSPAGRRKSKKNSPLRSAPVENSTQDVEPLSKSPLVVQGEDNSAQPLLTAGEPINKENELAIATTTPIQMLSMSAKRLRYQPKVDSPLLNDITDLS